MKEIYSILVILFLLCSCQDSEKDRIARLVKEWEGKEILFPTYSIFTIQGNDTVDFSFAERLQGSYLHRFCRMYQLQVAIASLEAIYA